MKYILKKKTRNVDFLKFLFTSFICGASVVEHGWEKSCSTPPLSFHFISLKVGGAMSNGVTRSE